MRRQNISHPIYLHVICIFSVTNNKPSPYCRTKSGVLCNLAKIMFASSKIVVGPEPGEHHVRIKFTGTAHMHTVTEFTVLHQVNVV